jgi:hypothetical protein
MPKETSAIVSVACGILVAVIVVPAVLLLFYWIGTYINIEDLF